ncbi:MAG: phosphatase PAP2 family protein [Gelidibacter sp.]
MDKCCFLVLYVFIVLHMLWAKTCHSQTPGSNDGQHEQWEYVLEDTGDVLQLALPLAAAFTTLVNEDWQGSKQFALSYATGFIVTHSLKKIIKKERPEGRNLQDAFPSGHTTSAFSGASFIQQRYGWKYGKWAYIAASIVGISRVEGPDGWHDYCDVLAGAIIGIGSTYLFTRPYKEAKVEAGFLSDGKETYVFSLKYQF